MFSNPDVIRRVNADFIPLALKAQRVNNITAAGDDAEARLYEQIRPAMLAPQGIGVLNSHGQVLEWVQMFIHDQSVPDFLDHSIKRYREDLEAKGALVTHAYSKFPDQRNKELTHDNRPAEIPEAHESGKDCPAEAHLKSRAKKDSLAVQVFGRALDKEGRPVADTVRQEHYIQDQFVLDSEFQKTVAETLTKAGKDRVRIDDLGKQIAVHAYLGHIDVGPFLPSNKGEWKRCEFWAQKEEEKGGVALVRIEGTSDVASTIATNGPGVHHITLTWEGLIEMKGNRMIRLLLLGHGKEKLQFAKDQHPVKSGEKEVAVLPGGRPIDVECGVRYGLIGVPGTMDQPPAALAQNSIQGKMQKLGRLVERWQKEGKNPTPIGKVMQKFEPLMKEGKTKEAEAVLDEALRLFASD